MATARRRSASLALVLGLTALAAHGPARAQTGGQGLNIDRHYSGVWLEIARTPMWLTDGCVAGTTSYRRVDARLVYVIDDCHVGSPEGKRRAIRGHGVIEDPGVGSRLKVTYLPFVTWRYQVMDHDPAGGWFIAADPKLKRLFVFTRTPPSPAELQDLVERARRTGYAGELETPPQ